MEKFSLKTNKTSRFGRKVNFGGSVVEFNKEGICEVEEKEVASKLTSQYGLEPLGVIENKSEEKEPEVVTEKTEQETFEDEIRSKTKRELVDLCGDMKFPKDEWEKLNAGDLKNYLIEKVKNAEK